VKALEGMKPKRAATLEGLKQAFRGTLRCCEEDPEVGPMKVGERRVGIGYRKVVRLSGERKLCRENPKGATGMK